MEQDPPTDKKRRGLALPPRGRAAARLQDLEAPAPRPTPPPEEPSPKTGIDAVFTASSNAVMQEVNDAAGRPAPPPRAARMTRPPSVKEPTTRITVDMPDSLHKQLSYLSVETRRSLKDLVIEALQTCYFRPSAAEDADIPAP